MSQIVTHYQRVYQSNGSLARVNQTFYENTMGIQWQRIHNGLFSQQSASWTCLEIGYSYRHGHQMYRSSNLGWDALFHHGQNHSMDKHHGQNHGRKRGCIPYSQTQMWPSKNSSCLRFNPSLGTQRSIRDIETTRPFRCWLSYVCLNRNVHKWYHISYNIYEQLYEGCDFLQKCGMPGCLKFWLFKMGSWDQILGVPYMPCGPQLSDKAISQHPVSGISSNFVTFFELPNARGRARRGKKSWPVWPRQLRTLLAAPG